MLCGRGFKNAKTCKNEPLPLQNWQGNKPNNCLYLKDRRKSREGKMYGKVAEEEVDLEDLRGKEMFKLDLKT